MSNQGFEKGPGLGPDNFVAEVKLDYHPAKVIRRFGNSKELAYEYIYHLLTMDNIPRDEVLSPSSLDADPADLMRWNDDRQTWLEAKLALYLYDKWLRSTIDAEGTKDE